MYLFAIWLVLTEIAYFVDYKIHNLFVPDVEFDAKLNINIDMTIAALCSGRYMPFHIYIVLLHMNCSFVFIVL